ncbi:SRPBCC family protein [Isoptericola cucumis]|uniref:Polyketide cyclase n=1 Tax=Isoptericola cucumis TaxID=1776856 RepID=A0ABQ2B5H3_9MICO|nr:SRPBCC family protein [Isoptericola cucumis]GGI06742.1 polyketide cyclase [Isoptericola cucumis]
MMSEQAQQGGQDKSGSFLDEINLGGLMSEVKKSVQSIGSTAVSKAADKLTDIGNGGSVLGGAAEEGAEAAAEGKSPVKGALKGGLSGLKDKVTDLLPGGGKGSSGGGDPLKAMNIAESIDVGVPVSVAYNQWTQFYEFPDFMKKVEHADAEEGEEGEEVALDFKAQVFWSHRTWTGTIVEQVPDELIVWRSEGVKGHVDGAVTFHEIAPRLTRILVVLEYYPQGFVERIGNIWRAAGRRARLELKHFRRHVMMSTMLAPDDVEGWRGEIRDGEVVETHEDALEREDQEAQEAGDEEYEEEPAGGEYEEEPAEGEYEEEPAEGEYEEEPAEGEYEEEPAEETAR